MAYIDSNPKSKKALQAELDSGEPVYIHQPGGLFPLTPDVVKDGKAFKGIEGPHYPKPHSWYGIVEYDPETHRVVRLLTLAEYKKVYR